MRKNMMLEKAFLILFTILAAALIEGEAERPFEPTPERWTIKIRGGRDAAETIARERGFEVYHEVSPAINFFSGPTRSYSQPSDPDWTTFLTWTRCRVRKF